MPERQRPQFEAGESAKIAEQAPRDPIAAFLEQAKKLPGLENVEPAGIDVSYLSPEERAVSLWGLFKQLRRPVAALRTAERAGTKEAKIRGKEIAKKRLQKTLGLLLAFYNDEEARTSYRDGFETYLREIDSINGDYEKYRALMRQVEVTEKEFDAISTELFKNRGVGIEESDTILYELAKRGLEDSRASLETLLREKPSLAAQAQYDRLRQYSRDLTRGFIWSPSRRAILEKFEQAAISGSPILLVGESGTGKTELVKAAALVLTGEPPNETPGKDVRFQDLIAKRDITGDKTSYRYQEIGEAFTGKESTLDEAPRHEGRFVLDDEFNTKSPTEQAEIMARVASWRPGRRVRMPVSNATEIIAPKALFCAAVNLAGPRYKREDIPAEVLRKFAIVDVSYIPQTDGDPELYEVMLGALMDKNRVMRAAREEISPEYTEREEVRTVVKDGQEIKQTVRVRELVREKQVGREAVPAGGFLWRFANAIAELNKSIGGKETVLKAKGEGQFVKKLIVDIGKLLPLWFHEYTTRERTESLEWFTVQKLNENLLSQSAYPKDDRDLAREFLKRFGIDVAKPKKEKPTFEILTPEAIGLLSPRVHYEKVVSEEPTITESYYITSSGKRMEYKIAPYVFGGTTINPGAVVQANDKSFLEFRGVAKEDGTAVFLPWVKKEGREKRARPEKLSPELQELQTTLEAALNNRAKQFGKPETYTITPPELPKGLTKEHLETMARAFGNGLEPRILPSLEDLHNLDADHMDMMYPKTQTPEDTNRGLTSYRPSWWNESAKVEGFDFTGETWGESYTRSMRAHLESIAEPDTSTLILLDTALKPAYDNGKQHYGTIEGKDPSKDPLLSLFQEVFGAQANRFNHSPDDIKTKLIPKLKATLEQALLDKGLPPIPFDIILVPAILENLEATTRTPALSTTNTWDWTSTPLLDSTGADTGRNLLALRSANGGASRLVNAPRSGSRSNAGARFAVVFKTTEHS